MKRLNSSDSLGDLISIRLPTEDCNQETSGVYGRDYYDEEGCVDESGQKKRRLSVVQVKALEKDFNVENKLEPDRKAKLAHELGLQPRQVAVWFQNRRARWKTKQLERDYGVLNANFDALKSNYHSVQQENEALVKEIGELKSKLQESSASTTSVKEELPISESEDQVTEYASTNRHSISSPSESDQPKTNELYNTYNNCVSIIKDRGASSDSSTILNNEESSSPNAANSSSSLLHFTEANGTNSYLPQFVKIEEHDFFSGDEACNFFLDDQVPSLQWYCTDQWS